MTELAVLSSIGTAITYKVNILMQVSAYLLPELVAGSLPCINGYTCKQNPRDF